MSPNEIGKNQGRYRQLLVGLGLLWLLLAAALLVYQQRTPARVEITWETATEQNTAGFRLYRRPNENGEFMLVNEDAIIESRGGPVSGAIYVYTDYAVEAGKTYFYLLEEIESNGSQRRYEDDLFEYQVPGTSQWIMILIVVCCVVGAVMLYVGLKEARKK